ncbi:hypothetical protein OOK58_00645 [Streptomyces sp. NBC_01728]|nr:MULTISPECIES: hypothetical protein [unclassified Streptomyces]MCX4461229.1 hypothetical protein [Streptomyces sp. NBC_01719]MCX4490137.1 hypothetical protein [Streptomyces sp. NBC_01728]MCX4596886.1 hypothetical protein [Streptomyces sp. NBC_01549]
MSRFRVFSPIRLLSSSSAAGPAIRPPAAMTFSYCSFKTGSLMGE